MFNYNSDKKIRKFQNDEARPHGGEWSRESLGLNTYGRKIQKFQNDEVPAHGGGSRELLGLNTCGRKIRFFFFKMMKYLSMGGGVKGITLFN